MPSLPIPSSERSKSRNLPPPSPSLSRKPSWKAAIKGHRSRSNSEVDDDSIVGGSVTPSKFAGLGGGGGGGGGGAGGGGEEEGRNGGHYGYAISSYDQVNRPRAHWTIAADVVAKGSTMPKKRLVPLLRELCIRIGDCTVCDGAFFGALLAILRSAKEGDWDGKAVRLVHFFVRGMVTVQGDTEGRVLGSHWEGRGITPEQILEAVECFREESEHRSAVRQIPAFHTLATLCQLASVAGVGGHPSPVEVLRDSTLAPLKSFQAQERPERGAKSKGRALRQRQEAFEESLLVSSAIFSAIRQCPALARDERILPAVLLGCCSENPLAARHAFAVLADQAAQSPDMVSQTLLSKAMLVPTTVGMLQAPGGLASSGEEPNLADSLACVYYLRAVKALAFADALDDTMRLDMYRTMVSSVSDARHRVALEAMQCLLDHPRAWELLVNAQRQSRDADIFRRVVDRIKVCVEEATAPATAAAAAATAAAAPSGPPSRPGSPPLPPSAPTDHGNVHRKKKGKSSAGVGDGPTGAGGSEAVVPCNWALAHAACRVCRVVGRTFQVAISYHTMQSQNRAGGEANGSSSFTTNAVAGGSTGASTGASVSERRGSGASKSNPRPPSINTRPGFSDALIPLGDGGNVSGNGNGNPSTPDTGAAFNLLGLPPSPAPRSGVTGASAWGATVEAVKGGGGGLRGGGDVMAGQVVEEQNTAAIRDLCRALQQHRLLESPHLHVRSLALEAMFLLVPDPSPLDPQLRGLWDWLQQRVEQCPSTLPDSVLSELVDTLLTRVQCSAASREEVIPIALALTESFMYQVPSEEMGRCVLRAWCQCAGYGGRARESVLQSVYRILDRDIALPPERPHAAFASATNQRASTGRVSADRRGSRHTRGMPSEDWTRQPGFAGAMGSEDGIQSGKGTPTVASGSSGSGGFATSLNGVSMILGGEEASRWGKAGGSDAGGQSEPPRLAYLRAKTAATRVKRSAYWFLGEYCCQLTGAPTHTDPAVDSPRSADQSPPSKPKPNRGDDLLEVWGSSSAPSRSDGGAARPPAASGFNGLEAGARVVAHPVVSAMNGATVSMMMRLKHAAMFEDFQTRYTCASALCKIALRLPDPVRFDAYCFLKGLADSAALFPLVVQRPSEERERDRIPTTASDAEGDSGRDGDGLLEGFRREQELLSERMEIVGAYGIGEVVTPVLDYLGCVYSSADKETSQQSSAEGSPPDKEASSTSAREAELLELYRPGSAGVAAAAAVAALVDAVQEAAKGQGGASAAGPADAVQT
eukprot:g1768.t1